MPHNDFSVKTNTHTSPNPDIPASVSNLTIVVTKCSRTRPPDRRKPSSASSTSAVNTATLIIFMLFEVGTLVLLYVPTSGICGASLSLSLRRLITDCVLHEGRTVKSSAAMWNYFEAYTLRVLCGVYTCSIAAQHVPSENYIVQ